MLYISIMANIDINRPETKSRSRYYFKPPPLDERTTLKLTSRVTNGRQVFAVGGNGRSAWSRRFKDLCARHVADLGGADILSEAQALNDSPCQLYAMHARKHGSPYERG
jgi:hypothetical protein